MVKVIEQKNIFQKTKGFFVDLGLQKSVGVAFVLLLVGGFAATFYELGKPQEVRQRAAETTPAVNTISNNPYSQIRSTTYFKYTPNPLTQTTFDVNDFARDLPKIKSVGFNAVEITVPWVTYNPTALPTPLYNTQAFTDLKKILQTAKDQNMKVLMRINYMGPTWAPQGIDACNYLNNPVMYKAYTDYVTYFLNQIKDYHDTVLIMVHTEGTECNVNPNYPTGYDHNQAKTLAALLRKTLGVLPNQLPADLRAKFKFGFHDYTLINKNYANGESFTTQPTPFDFLSGEVYSYSVSEEFGRDMRSDADLATVMDTRAGRFKALHPNTPLIFSELGATSCPRLPWESINLNPLHNEAEQARIDATLVKHAIEKSYGFSLWMWSQAPSGIDCDMNRGSYAGVTITREDGTDKPAKAAVVTILHTPLPQYRVTWGTNTMPSSVTIRATLSPTISFTNSGAATWSPSNIKLGYLWYSGACPSTTLLINDGHRGDLLSSVTPGGTVNNLGISVLAPSTPGAYCLKFDLVYEGVCWFGGNTSPCTASPTNNITVTVNPAPTPTPTPIPTPTPTPAPQYRVTWGLNTMPTTVTAGTTLNPTVSFTNSGAATWSPSNIKLGYLWYAGACPSTTLLINDGHRGDLSSSITPGGTVNNLGILVAAPAAGTYCLKFDLVYEGVCWFGGGTSPCTASPTSNSTVTVKPSL